jgi:hypothetical protein
MNWLTTAACAAKAGITATRIGQCIKKGLLPATKVNRRYRVAESDFDKFSATRQPGRNDRVDCRCYLPSQEEITAACQKFRAEWAPDAAREPDNERY